MAINLENLNAAFAAAGETVNEMNGTNRQELIPMSEIVAAEYNPYNENDNDENVSELAASIEAYGLIEPLCVNRGSDGLYHLISGERRFKAISRLNWKSVPCVVYDGLEAVQAELRLHEANLETREYTSAQKFGFYKRVKELLEELKDNGKLSGGLQKNIADMLHISERQVRKYDSISQLPDEIQDSVMDGDMTINRAYNLSQDYKSMTEKITQKTIDDISDEVSLDDSNRTDREYSDGDFSPSEAVNEEMLFPEKTENNIIDEENSENVVDASSKSQSCPDEIAQRKYLEKGILFHFNPQEILKFYLMNLPTPKEAIKEFLFTSNHRGTSCKEISVTERQGFLFVESAGMTFEFRYSEVESCIRDMIRSGRLLDKKKHLKLNKLLRDFFDEVEENGNT